MRLRYLIVTFVLLLIASFLAYSIFIEPNRVVVEHVPVVLDDLPAELDGFRIVQISDLELWNRELDAHSQRVLAQVNALHGDLIAITGDLIGTGSNYEDALVGAAAFVHSLQAKYGVWIARGENDFVEPLHENERFLQEISAPDVHVLVNEAAQIGGEVDGQGLYIAGAEYMKLRPNWATDFVVEQQQSERVLSARWSQHESFNHYGGGNAQAWQNYEFSGRFYHARAGGQVGVVVYSQMLEGLYRYYSLGHEGQEYFLLRDSEGIRSASTGVEAMPRSWYSFRVRVENAEGFTDVRAKLWPAREAEPVTWQAIIQDDSPTRSTHGTVGLLANGVGPKLYDDLLVTALSPTSAGGEQPSNAVYLDEDFSDYILGQNLADWVEYGSDGEALQKAVRGLPEQATIVLLMHSVDLAKRAEREKVDLMLSGGTHGGQVRLPLLGALYTGTEMGPKYSAGLFRFGKTQVYITRGIGTSIFPIRFLAPPEITVLELRAASKTAE